MIYYRYYNAIGLLMVLLAIIFGHYVALWGTSDPVYCLSLNVPTAASTDDFIMIIEWKWFQLTKSACFHKSVYFHNL